MKKPILIFYVDVSGKTGTEVDEFLQKYEDRIKANPDYIYISYFIIPTVGPTEVRNIGEIVFPEK